MNIRWHIGLLAAVLALAALPADSRASSITWNVAGSGNWDTGSANWTGDSTTFTDDGTVDVTFNNTAGGTITISAGMSPLSTTVSAASGAYTFSGGPIDSGSLVKSGAGTLTLSSANTFSGGTTLNNGTLYLASGTAIGSGTITINGGTLQNSGGAVTLSNNNTVNINGNCYLIGINTGTGTFTIAGPVTISGGYTVPNVVTGPGSLSTLDISVVIPWTTTGVTFSNTGTITLRSNQTFTTSIPVTSGVTIVAPIADGGAGYGVTFAGSGYFDQMWSTLFLTGANTYSGQTVINSGVNVCIGSGGAAGSLNPAGTIVNSGTFCMNRSDNITQGTEFGLVTGTGKFAKKGGGTLVLNSSTTNTYTGVTGCYGGVLSVDSILNAGVNSEIGAYPTAGAGGIELNGGTLRYTGGSTNTDRGFTVSGNTGTIDVNTAGTALTMGACSLGNATFSITGGSGSSLTLGTVTLAGYPTVSPASGMSVTFPSVTGAAYGMTKSGAGTLYLTGANNHAGTTLSQGVLSINDDGNLGANTATLTFNNGTLQFAAGSTVTLNTSRPVTLNGGTTSFVDTSLAAGTVAGVISGSGNLTKIGSNALTLTAANTFTGNAKVTGGTLKLGAAAALQYATYDTTGSNGSTIGLDVNGYAEPVLGGLGGSINLASAIVGYGSVTNLVLNPQSGSVTYSAIIADGSSGMMLTKTGAGTMVLGGNNSYTGATIVKNGILNVSGALSASSPVNVTAGGISGTGTIGGNVTLSGSGSIDLRDAAIGNLTIGGYLAINGAVGANSLYFDLANNGTTTDKILVTGNTTVGTPGAALIQLNQIGSRIQDGTYTLIQGTGSMPAVENFTLAASKAYGLSFVLSVSGNNLQLTTTRIPAGPAAAFWRGSSANWSTLANWNTDATSGTTASEVPGYQTDVSFYTTTPAAGNLSCTLDTDFDIKSLTFTTAATSPVTVGGTKTVTIENSAGITVNTPSSGTVTHTINANVSLASSQTWTVNPNATLTIGGAASDFSGTYTLTKAGTGTLNLNGATTVGSLYIATAADAGSVVVGGGGTMSVGSGPACNLYVGTANNSSGTLDVSQSASFVANVGSVYIGVAQSGVKGNLFLGTNNTITASTVYSVGEGTWGGGCLATNTTAAGGLTTVHTPVFRIGFGTANGISSGSGVFVLGSGASLALDGISGSRAGLIVGYVEAGNGAGSCTATMDLSAGVASLKLNSLLVGGRTANNTTTGTLTLGSGANHIDISAAGSVLTVGSSNGGTSSGTVTIGNLDATSSVTSTDGSTAIRIGYRGPNGGTSTGTLSLNGGTLTITTTGTAIGGGTGTSTLNLSGCTLIAGASSASWIQGLTTATLATTVTIDSGVNNITVPQVFSGTGGLTKSGAGTLTLTRTNLFTGAVAVNAGTLQLGNGSNGNDGSLTNACGGVNIAANAGLAYNLYGTSTVSYAISCAGSVKKLGAGTLVLAGTNVFQATGRMIVSNGVLRLVNTNALSANASLFLYGGGTNDLSFVGTNTIAFLYIDDVFQPAGTYGTNNVQYTNTAFFTGPGALNVTVPIIGNKSATGLATNAATLNATLSAPGTNYDVYVHFGTTDGGASFGTWTTNHYVGSWTNVNATNISYQMTGLTAGTAYYYTFRVTNAGVNVWATPSIVMYTLGPPVVSTLPPTNVGIGTATLQGSLLSTGGVVTTVYTYWGTSDGSTNRSNWASVYTNGVMSIGAFSVTPGNLLYGLTYYYRAYASNSYGGAWAPGSASFTTLAPHGRGSYSTSGLIGVWTFDDGTPNDSSGNGYNGSAVNGPTYSAGDTKSGKGKSLVLDSASSQFVMVDTGGSQTVFDGGTGMTVSAWVKGWPAGGWNPFICKNGEPGGWQMRRYSTGNNLSYTRRGLGNSDFPGNTTAVSDGSWHMVTMTYNGASSKIYVDSALDATDNNGGTITAVNSRMCFGARDNGGFGNYFSGKLDDIFFYNRALTPPEITNLYNIVGTTGFIPDSFITNLQATAVSNNSVTLNAALCCTGAVYDVYACWNTVNGGTSLSSWTNSAYVGSWTNLASTNISYTATGLTPSAVYYFTFRAANACTNMWATNVLSFMTQGPPVVDNGGGATLLDGSSALLRGNITAGTTADVYICWGTIDGGIASGTGAWASAAYVGALGGITNFSTVASGLSSGQTYLYRCYASNVYGTAWASPAASFNVTPFFTFTNIAAGSPNWNTAGNWDSSGVPVSTNNSTVRFFADTTSALGGDVTITNDQAALMLNTLTLNGLAKANTATINTIGTTGSVWTLTGTSPRVTLNSLTNGTGSMTVTVNPDIVLSNGVTISGNGDATFKFAGSISGTGNVVKTGSSTVTLVASNTYAGATIISNGTIKLTVGGSSATGLSYLASQMSMGSGWRTVSTAKTYDIDGNNVLGSDGYYVVGSNQRTLQPAYVSSWTMNGSIYGGNGSYASIDDPNTTPGGSPTTITSGTTTPGGNNVQILTFTLGGAVPNRIRLGVMLDGLDGAAWNPYGVYMKQIGGAALQSVTVDTSGGSYNDRNPDWLFFDVAGFAAGDQLAVYGNQGNNGTVTLQAFSFDSIASSGASNRVNILPAGTALSIAGGGTLDLNGSTQTVYSLSNAGGGGGLVTNGAAGTTASLSIGPSGGTNTFSGSIRDTSVTNAISLVKTGAAVQILSGTNTFRGGMTIDGGTLDIGGSGQLGSGAYTSRVSIASGATLRFNSLADQALSGVLSGAGSLVKASSGTLTLGAADTYTGATLVSGGILRIGASAPSAVGSVSLSQANTYSFTPASGNLLAGRSPTSNNNGSGGAEGTGPVTKLTDGAIVANNAETYTIGNNATLVYSLGGGSGGYDVTKINIYSGWNDSGRENITLTSIKVSTPDAPDTFNQTIPSSTINYEGGSSIALAALTPSGGVIASGVAKIQFNFGGQENGYVGYREIEVVGAPCSPKGSITNSSIVTVGAGARLTIENTNNVINDIGTVNLNSSGPGYGVLYLTNGVNETVGFLNIDSVSQPAGTYGYSGSGCAHTNDNFFAGAGVLTVSHSMDVPSVNNAGGATNQTAGSATLRGVLASGGSANVWICWGTNDPGTDATSAWNNVSAIGYVVEGAAFSSIASGLNSNVTYWYRCYASNSYGRSWATPATSFNAVPAGGNMSGDGGTVTNYTLNGTNYTAHIFTSSGTMTLASGGNVDVLVVGGGGGNGMWTSGGGGGGFFYTNGYAVGAGNITVTVGAGGVAAQSPNNQTATGSNSVFGSLIAYGGTGGPGYDNSGDQGGYSTDGGVTTNAGNLGYHGPFDGAFCSGAGAGHGGYKGDSQPGGSGTNCWITGSDVWYAGGGGGNANGAGGLGGGGHGSYVFGGPADAGAPNTGGGGGGSWGGTGGAGGSGIVVVRYVSGGIGNLAPTSISNASAILNASLSCFGTNYDVYVHWGRADKTNSFAWDSSAYVGSYTNVAKTNISYAINGLNSSTTYYYTFRATNALPSVWASPSWTFNTPWAAPKGTTYIFQ